MTRRQPRLEDVWEWYEFQRLLVGEEKSRVLDAVSSGHGVVAIRYVGKTRAELEEDFAFQIAELEQLTMLGLLASTEAALRVDFHERVRNKKRDAISRAFRRRYKESKKVRLVQDILDVWKDLSGRAARSAVSKFKGSLKLRDWLAHGRYWTPKLGSAGGYDPVDVFEICAKLLNAVGLMA